MGGKKKGVLLGFFLFGFVILFFGGFFFFKGQREIMDLSIYFFLILRLLVCCLQEVHFNVASEQLNTFFQIFGFQIL